LRRMVADGLERVEAALARRWLDLRGYLDERGRWLWLEATGFSKPAARRVRA
jgi:hypothetical protein